ncbi:MAG TPA: SpoIID/LytB domain-containing protein [Armatimonadota bacterium]|jgi:stage II sporulation protein D
MPLPRLNITISPLAFAIAIGTALTCAALLSGRHLPARPQMAEAPPPRPVHRNRHIHRAAFQKEPIVRAEDFLTGAGLAAPQETVRVLITKAAQKGRVTLTSEADLLVVNPETHSAFARVPAGMPYMLSLSDDGRDVAGPGGSDLPCATVRIISLNASRPITIGTRAYLGAIEVRVGDSGLEVVNEVRREDYIAGVLAGESVKAFPLGALKAQAVAARTFALSQSGHRPNGIDVVDTVADQVYGGTRSDWPEIRQAVEETAGIIATYHDEPIVAYFSADCGGQTRSNAAAGLSHRELPYLLPVVDAPAGGPDYCSASPRHTWTLDIPAADIIAKLNAKGGTKLAAITDIRFNRVSADGRVGEVEVEGLPVSEKAIAPAAQPGAATPAEPKVESPAAQGDSAADPGKPVVPVAPADPGTAPPTPEPVKSTFAGYEFRKMVGTNVLKSQIMTVSRSGEDTWTFSGRGYGHGVGLCQWGACGMARAGIGYDAILKHYYTGIELTHEKQRTGILEGRARDISGAFAPGALVQVAGAGLEAVADREGFFQFKDLPAGTYDLVVTPKGGQATVSFAWRVKA